SDAAARGSSMPPRIRILRWRWGRSRMEACHESAAVEDRMISSADQWDRRDFLRGAVFAGATGLAGLGPGRALPDTPPAATTVKLLEFASACQGPLHAAEELLRGEGFTGVQYVKTELASLYRGVPSGDAHFAFYFSADLVTRIHLGDPIVTIAGIHVGC